MIVNADVEGDGVAYLRGRTAVTKQILHTATPFILGGCRPQPPEPIVRAIAPTVLA